MSRNFQWASIFGAVCLVPSLGYGADDASREATSGNLPKSPFVRNESDRDPTAPSPRMLERIGASKRTVIPLAVPSESRPREVTTTVAQLPEIRIKAIVFSDDDNGSAILTANSTIGERTVPFAKRIYCRNCYFYRRRLFGKLNSLAAQFGQLSNGCSVMVIQ